MPNIGDPLLLSNAVRLMNGTTLFNQNYRGSLEEGPWIDLSSTTRWIRGYGGGYSQFSDGTGAVVGMSLNQEIEFYPTNTAVSMMPGFADAVTSAGSSGPLTIQPRKLTTAELSFLNTRLELARLRWLSGAAVTFPEGLMAPFYMEVTAQLPTAQGTWPAFWLLPDELDWPALEIDTLEGFNDNDGNRRITTSVHCTDSTWRAKVIAAGGATYVSDEVYPHATATQDIPVTFDPAAGFHRYGSLVYNDFIYTVIDGVIVWKWPTPSTVVGRRVFALLNYAIGGQPDFAGTPDGGTTVVPPMIISDFAAYRMPDTYGGTVITPTPVPTPTPTPTPTPGPTPTPPAVPPPTPPGPEPIVSPPTPTPTTAEPIPTPNPIPPPPAPIPSTTYDVAEVGTYTGTDARLYRFQIGSAVWFYNNSDRDVVWNGVTWKRIQISDDGLKQKGEAVSDDFVISVEATIPLITLFNGTPPTNPIQVILFQLQYGDNIAPIMWVGYVSSVRYKDNVSADIVCNTQTAYLNRKGLRLSWSRACPHALYDQACGLDRAAWGEEAMVTGLGGNFFSYTITAPSGRADGRFRNGYVEWTVDNLFTHRRPIMEDNVLNAIVSGLTDGMTIGMLVTMYPGCERTPAACKTFDNLSNYGGFPMMPGRSPFDGNPVF